MTVEEMSILFETLGESHNYDGIKNLSAERRLSNRPDLNAFMLLDKLLPGDSDIVSSAGHDQIWLGVDLDALAAVITPEQVQELVWCGVGIEDDSLYMFA